MTSYSISDNQAKSSPVQWVIALVLLAFAIIFWRSIKAALDKLMSATGLTSADISGYSDEGSAWDVNYWKTHQVILSDGELNILADKINNAAGFFNDDEDAIYAAFNKLKTKGDVSKLNDIFTTKYQKDVLMYLNSFMNTEELQPVVEKVNNLN
jgi:hypothetical protein